MRSWCLVIALAAGCASPGPFACEVDGNCEHEGALGVCQPQGFCSFVDMTCPFGQRFDATADDALAGQCVTYDVGCIAQLAMGENHSCVRAIDGRAFCWGGDGFGQVGDGASPDTIRGEVPVTSLRAITDLTTGTNFSCGVDSGLAYCWGQRSNIGKLGDGGTSGQSPTPVVAPLPETPATQVSISHTHGCARVASGKLYCWGGNGDGKFGDGTTSPSAMPVIAAGGALYDEVATGQDHTCGRRGDVVECWGNDQRGQLGNNRTLLSFPMPVTVIGLEGRQPTQLALGALHSCARTTDGDVYCWGEGDDGRLGFGAPGADQLTARRIDTLSNVIAITAGEEFTCALDAFGIVTCFGANEFGQLGDDTLDPHAIPVPVLGMTDAIAIDAGAFHVCARRRDGSLACWGNNDVQQSIIGGDMVPARTPTPSNFACLP